MSDNVYKVIHLVGSSSVGIEQVIENAITRANSGGTRSGFASVSAC